MKLSLENEIDDHLNSIKTNTYSNLDLDRINGIDISENFVNNQKDICLVFPLKKYRIRKDWIHNDWKFR